ncbi:hypothetical protein GDO86_004991 [Hymenochirus boettgeri]|uniref:Lactosylceramide 4-alpha-galactosyltransferase n=1 Tax=Hymenochirus boettgeri TaxID=247094 RepID=A0A8T2J881_9PIPI|nr:hypothetical protein GDO86_004991 [Hymenochirus boettgeri]
MIKCPSQLVLPRFGIKKKSWTFIFFLLTLVPLLIIMHMKPIDLSKDPEYWPIDVKCPNIVPNATNPSHETLLGGGVFFVETSERTNPSFQFMCAVESIVRIHPNIRVTVMMRGVVNQNSSGPQNLGFRLFHCFPNVDIVPLDFDQLFAGTPLNTWYNDVKHHKELTDLPILSDACRLAILWKYGGIYLDTDFIVLKSVANITNALGTQSIYTLNGAFLSFTRRHPFIGYCMEDFANSYNFWIYGHQGPQLLTRVFKRWCSIRRLRDSRGCRGVTVLAQEAFYPVEWQNWREYFESISPVELSRKLRATYAVHLWNKKSRDTRPSPGSFLDQLQSGYCPTSYGLMKISRE